MITTCVTHNIWAYFSSIISVQENCINAGRVKHHSDKKIHIIMFVLLPLQKNITTVRTMGDVPLKLSSESNKETLLI